MGNERKGEIRLEVAETCVKLQCPLFQEKPFASCQVKNTLDRAGEKPNVQSEIKDDYGTIIPKDCPMGYDDFRKVSTEIRY